MRVLLAALLLLGSYESAIESWRDAREARLKADDGWLTVAGLFWLKPGANSVGSAEPADVVLPRDAAPERLGTLELAGDRARFRPAPAVAAAETVLQANAPGALVYGRLKLLLIERGGRYAIRLKDNASEMRKRFTHLNWFPVDESWRITARFVQYPAPRKMTFASAIGIPQEMASPGYVEFARGGATHRLEPVSEGNRLFFVFRDATSGKSTYGGGRFLYADPPRNGFVLLDFNKAENPPCVFTPYATCPLPPKQNRLAIAVAAGEKMYGHPH